MFASLSCSTNNKQKNEKRHSFRDENIEPYARICHLLLIFNIPSLPHLSQSRSMIIQLKMCMRHKMHIKQGTAIRLPYQRSYKKEKWKVVALNIQHMSNLISYFSEKQTQRKCQRITFITYYYMSTKWTRTSPRTTAEISKTNHYSIKFKAILDIHRIYEFQSAATYMFSYCLVVRLQGVLQRCARVYHVKRI
jgi:hypothetical protein